ncbi:TIGR04104 family putative zinc finger protein [Paenibacillus shenyangensis]|uniref:TIGR04104 family putative zinc finger protein n=1 Tax=Paenibacillus sp. A9 TaxID=1284352 RepID=UPI0003627062
MLRLPVCPKCGHSCSWKEAFKMTFTGSNAFCPRCKSEIYFTWATIIVNAILGSTLPLLIMFGMSGAGQPLGRIIWFAGVYFTVYLLLMPYISTYKPDK